MEKVGEVLPRKLGPRKDINILVPRTQLETDAIAEKLVALFKSPEHRPFFLRAAWRLSEARIMQIAEKAMESGYNSPRAYFIKSVKREKDYYV